MKFNNQTSLIRLEVFVYPSETDIMSKMCQIVTSQKRVSVEKFRETTPKGNIIEMCIKPPAEGGKYYSQFETLRQMAWVVSEQDKLKITKLRLPDSPEPDVSGYVDFN